MVIPFDGGAGLTDKYFVVDWMAQWGGINFDRSKYICSLHGYNCLKYGERCVFVHCYISDCNYVHRMLFEYSQRSLIHFVQAGGFV